MPRKFLSLIFIILAVVLLSSTTLSLPGTALAQDGVHAWTTIDTNLRTGPGRNFDIITTLPTDIALIIEARDNPKEWILVHTQDNKYRGWIIVKLLRFANGVNIGNFGVSGETLNPPAAPAQPVQPAGGGSPPAGDLNAPFAPKITAGIRAQMRAIYAKGKKLGNNPRVFSKVGDCLTDHWAFLNQIGYGHYQLGEYGYLQATIEYFMVSPRPGVNNPFDVDSIAAHNGFNSAAVLDKDLSDKNICQEGESSLECEYRLNKPAVAVIMFGTADVFVMTPEQFRTYLTTIVKKTLDLGIVPILSTFPENQSQPEKSRQINQIVLAIARSRSLPVINLAGALKSLPNQGLQGDGIYLTLPPDNSQSTFFDAEHLQYGYTVRNLLTLQALDAVWKSILR